MKASLNKLLFLFLFSTFILSCQKDKSREGDCDTLSMKCYRGFPRSCNELEKRCNDKEIKFTKELCQDAFNKLILSKDLTLVKKLYSKRIEECFNERERKKYK